MSFITQPSKMASEWTPVKDEGIFENAEVIKDNKGRLFRFGRKRNADFFMYAYMNRGDNNFSTPQTLSVGFFGSSASGGKPSNFRLVQSGNSLVQICVQGTDGKIYVKYLDPEDETVNIWIPIAGPNTVPYKDNKWGVTGIDDNWYFVYGLGTGHGQQEIHYALIPYNLKAESAIPTYGSMNANDTFVDIAGITNLEGQITIIASRARVESGTYSSYQPGEGYRASKFIGTNPQIVQLTDGTLQQMWLTSDGNIHGYAQPDPAAQLSGLIQVTAQAKSFVMKTDSIGTPVIIAHWKDDSIQMCVANGPNGVFTDWIPITNAGLNITHYSASPNFYGGFYVYVSLEMGFTMMCSTTVDDRLNTLPDSKGAANQQLGQIRGLADQLKTMHKGIWDETNTETMASPVKGAMKEINGYKKTLVNWVKDLADALGEEGFKILMDAESLEKTVGAHLHLNDFKPKTALDFLKPEDFKTYIDKGVSVIKDKMGSADYRAQLTLEFGKLVNHMKSLTSMFDMPMPLNIAQLEHHTIPMLEHLPDQVIDHLSKLIPNLDFSPLGNAIDSMDKEIKHKHGPNGLQDEYKLERLFSPETIRIMALASAACKIVASLLNVANKTLPLKVGLGINLVIAASAKARAVVEADVSAGVDAGVGVSVPILGIGVFAGAGAGNGTLLKIDAIWIGLTPALLCPFSALCLSANTILESLIKSNKQFVKVE